LRYLLKYGREYDSTNEDREGIPQGRGEHVKLPVPIEGIGDKVLDQLISIGENESSY